MGTLNIATIVLAVATIILAIFTLISAKATLRIAKVSQDEKFAKVRPIVIPCVRHDKLIGGGSSERLYIDNIGEGAASNVKISATPVDIQSEPDKDLCKRIMKMNRGIFIGAKMSFFLVSMIKRYFDKINISIVYEDIYSKVYRTQLIEGVIKVTKESESK